ncbi:MAG: HNH endonuclease family protein [Spirochaetia bacterium]
MVNLLKTAKVTSSRATLHELIFEAYLINKHESEQKRIRLKNIREDQSALEALFSADPTRYIGDSNITRNYLYFESELVKDYREDNIDPLYETLQRLVAVDISLNQRFDNPQEIFESINSTGMALETSDLVRNFLLMNIGDYNKQEKLYTDYWKPIEDQTKGRTDDFLRDYLTYRNGSISNKRDVYRDFKEFFKKQKNYQLENIDFLTNFFRELHFSAQAYGAIVQPNKKNHQSLFSPKIMKALLRFSRVDNTTAYPFFFDVLSQFCHEKIGEEDAAEIIIMIESYTVRRAICRVPTNAMNKIFAALPSQIAQEQERNPGAKYIDVLKALFLQHSPQHNGRFPRCEEVLISTKDRNFYNLKLRDYIFERLENYDDQEIIKTEDYTIEHIMPQNLSAEWKANLGDDIAKHAQYLHTLGNLTLLGPERNTKYANKSFLEKRDMPGGFTESRLRINADLKSIAVWGIHEILERSACLAKEMITIWKPISTSYTLQSKQIETEEFDLESVSPEFFTSRTPTALIIKTQEYSLATFRQLLHRVTTYLYNLNKEIFEVGMQLLPHIDYEVAANDSHEIEVTMMQTTRVDKGFKSEDVFRTIQRLVSHYGEDYITLADIVVQLKKEGE